MSPYGGTETLSNILQNLDHHVTLQHDRVVVKQVIQGPELHVLHDQHGVGFLVDDSSHNGSNAREAELGEMAHFLDELFLERGVVALGEEPATEGAPGSHVVVSTKTDGEFLANEVAGTHAEILRICRIASRTHAPDAHASTVEIGTATECNGSAAEIRMKKSLLGFYGCSVRVQDIVGGDLLHCVTIDDLWLLGNK